MKKKMCCFALTLLLLAAPASAHSGRSDSSGGHYDRATGEYHYHHGYPAHQHENGICPYDFDDRTGENSGGSGSGSSATDSGGGAKSASPDAVTNDSSRFPIPISAIVVGSVIVFFVLLSLFATIPERMQTRKYQQQWKARRNERRKELLDLYGGKTKQEIASECGMPDGIEIGPDGLPKETSADGWGDSLTFYVSPSGQAYHQRPTCTRSADIPIHAANLEYRSPCHRCFPCVPDMDWYWRYRSILNELERYEIKVSDYTADESA